MKNVERIAIVTLGCKVNRAESEELATVLASRGFEIVPDIERSDLSIINTCAVTAESDHKSRKLVNRALRAGKRVIVTGCTVDVNSGGLAGAPEIRLVPNSKKMSLPDDLGDTPLRGSPAKLQEGILRTRAFIKVQDGCDRRCTYCVVPLARGASRSLGRVDIMESVERALARGAVEFVLTGVNLGDYGIERGETLTGLVRELTDMREVGRVRLSSLEIDHLGAELSDEISGNPKLCNHLHLPIQSGDDGILRKMGRPYSADAFLRRVDKLRDRVPDIAITTDVMVGFPGEGDLEYRRTMEAIASLEPAKLHVFRYSARPNTPAATMDEQVSPEAKAERAGRLRVEGARWQERFIALQAGNCMETVIIDRTEQAGYRGLTDNYVSVEVASGEDVKPDRLQQVRIEEVRGTRATGIVERGGC